MDKCCGAGGFVAALDGAGATAVRETVLEVEGASCGACVARIEAALRAVPGVASATFDLRTRRARIGHAPEADPTALRSALARAGYAARAPSPTGNPRRESRMALLRTGVAGLAMMQVMMLAYPVYVADAGSMA